ncbi:hypothetical protein MTR67_008695 [Solanum verrucosum]|uniref:Chromo domain-containing protein n=1 Tax=Solanum verrucosum TaxID=315347 RepID=A0AAF0TJM2_SOLVR|nr:hypothetical protein MTR67_008695 [Solanum verrucosum]
MVADIRSMMSLFVVGLPRLSNKKSKATMLIGDMGIARLMIHVQQVEEDKLRAREEFKNKRKGPAPSSASAPAPAPRNEYEYNSQNSQNFRAKHAYSQGSKAQGSTKTLACAKCEVYGRSFIIIQTEDIGIKDSLSYEEIPVQILDCQVRKLRTKEVVSVKVFWRNQFVEEATWEAEEDMKKRYSHLFGSGEVSN